MANRVREVASSEKVLTETGRSARVKPRRIGPRPVDQDGRERILVAAIRSFSELGYEGTTTARVARDAGVTQPLVHHHFGSKDGLWRAAMDDLFKDAGQIVEAGIAASIPDRLMAIAAEFLRFAAAHPALLRVVAREAASPGPRLEFLVDRYLRDPYREVIDSIRAGQRLGIIAPEVRAELVLFVILGTVNHLFDFPVLAKLSLGIDSTAASTLEDFLVLGRTLLERGLFRRPPRPPRTPNGDGPVGACGSHESRQDQVIGRR